jgi:homoserine dehydrogenase
MLKSEERPRPHSHGRSALCAESFNENSKMTPQPLQLDVDSRPTLHEFPTFPAALHRNDITTPFEPYSDGVASTSSAKAPRTVRVALAGCGVVGGGLVRLLHESAAAVAARFGLRFEITNVLVRDVYRERNLPLDPGLYTNDLGAFLRHDADVIIEAVGGDEPARTIASSALKRGKKVITANKELVASHGAVLSALALDNEACLDFGAAVGGSAPVISTLRDLVGASTPLSVRGILNGTSNYVISLLEEGASLDDAVARARECGLAESDCARDLDGRDAAAKLAIIAWITFGIAPADLQVRRTPLTPELERLVRLATVGKSRVRLLAECTQLPGHGVSAAVEPVIVSPSSGLGRTHLEENRVEVDLGWGLPLSVSGPGAGGRPTAAALLSDLLRVSPPPNERGLGATQFISVTDPREHRWFVGARLDAASLRRAAIAGGLTPTSIVTNGTDSAVVVAPVRWKGVQRLIRTLESLNAVPCVARYEADGGTEVLQ